MLNEKIKKNWRIGIFVLFLFIIMNAYAVNNAPTQDEKPYIGGFEGEPLNESIVGYWRLEGNGIDETGINNGSLVGFDNTSVSGATTDGRVGSAFNFDGDGDRIDVPWYQGFNFTGKSFTMGAWVYWLGSADSNNYIIQQGEVYTRMSIDPNNNLSGGVYGYGSGIKCGAIPTNAWSHVIYMVNGTDNILYHNGAFLCSTPLDGGTANSVNVPLRIGGHVVLADRSFNGTIDEVSIWNVSLSAQEIADMYQNSSYKYYTNQDLGVSSNESSDVDLGDEDYLTSIFNWYEDNESFTVLNMPFDTYVNNSYTKDYSGYGNDGTVYGAVKTQSELNSSQTSDADLVGYWKLNKESNSSQATDSSTYGNDGNVIGANTNATGRIKGGFEFDGDGDYVDVGNLGIPENGTATLGGWFYFKQNASDKGNYIDLFYGSGVSLLYQHHVNDHLYVRGADYFSVSSVITLNTWHHIVMTYSGDTSTNKLYVDGVEYDIVIQSGADANPALDSVKISSSIHSFNGSIDEVSIWNKSLSASEIDELYRKGKESIVGGAMDFDGVDDYVEQTVKLVSDYPFTLSSWAKINSDATGDSIVMITDKDDIDRIFSLWIDTNNNPALIARQEGGSPDILVDTTTDVTGVWTHVVGVFTSATSRELFVNGVSKGTDTDSVSYDTAIDRWCIGRSCDFTPDNYMNGTIDQVKIYNRSLSAEQIRINYLKGLEGHDNNVLVREETSKDKSYHSSVWVSDGVSETSQDNSTWVGILNSIPTVPNLLTPADGTTITDISPTFTWTTSTDVIDEDPITYGIEIATDSGFSTIVQLSYEQSGTSYTASSLFSDIYYWRVFSTDGEDNSSYTPYRTFTIETSQCQSWFVENADEEYVFTVNMCDGNVSTLGSYYGDGSQLIGLPNIMDYTNIVMTNESNTFTEDQTMEKDLIVDGNVTAENVFLPAYIRTASNATQTCPGGSSWVNITFQKRAETLKNNIEHTWDDATNDTITINDAGVYHLDIEVSIRDTAGSPSAHVGFRLITNQNGIVAGSYSEIDTDEQNAEIFQHDSFLAEFVAGEEIKLQFTADDATVQTIPHGVHSTSPSSAQISIHRIH